MRKIITYGTFDLFHYGHYNLLKRAKELGDFLIVGVSSDDLCKQKGKIPVLNENKRMEIVSNLRFVDQVILEKNMEQKVDDVKNIKGGVNVFVLGDDYKDVFPKMKEYNQLVELGCKVIFLERTPDVSTTKIKQQLAEQSKLENILGVPKSVD